MQVRRSRKHKASEVICFCFLDEISEGVKAGRKGVLEVWEKLEISQKSQVTRRTTTMPRVHLKCVDTPLQVRPVQTVVPFLQPHASVWLRPELGGVGIWVGRCLTGEGRE